MLALLIVNLAATTAPQRQDWLADCLCRGHRGGNDLPPLQHCCFWVFRSRRSGRISAAAQPVWARRRAGSRFSLFAMAKLAAPYFSDGGMDFDGIRLLLQLHPWRRPAMMRPRHLLHAAANGRYSAPLHGETACISGGCVTFAMIVLAAVVCYAG